MPSNSNASLFKTRNTLRTYLDSIWPSEGGTQTISAIFARRLMICIPTSRDAPLIFSSVSLGNFHAAAFAIPFVHLAASSNSAYAS